MADSTVTAPATDDDDDSGLKRSITGRQLFFYTLGDVLGLRHLRPDRPGRRGRRRRVLDRLRRRRLRRRHHRLGVRRAGHQVPPGRRRLALRQQGVRQQGADLPDHRVLPLRQLRGHRVAGDRVRVVLRRAVGGPPAAAGVAGVRRGAGARQLHRHHRVGGDEHADDLRRARRPDHRHDHRHLVRRPGQRRLRRAASTTSASPATRRWRSSPVSPSPSSP